MLASDSVQILRCRNPSGRAFFSSRKTRSSFVSEYSRNILLRLFRTEPDTEYSKSRSSRGRFMTVCIVLSLCAVVATLKVSASDHQNRGARTSHQHITCRRNLSSPAPLRQSLDAISCSFILLSNGTSSHPSYSDVSP